VISMKLEIINPHVLKIIIAARPKDSIKAISDRIGVSYGWVHKWVGELANQGVFRLTRMNMFLNENNDFYKKTVSYIQKVMGKDIQFRYSVLQLFGIKYAFTQTDSVYVWTKGGYNIARYKKFYPIFVKVRKKDRELFENYCRRLGLGTNKKGGVFYQVMYVEDFKIERCDDVPVDSLSDTIAFMEKNIYNFEPALEMIKEMYGKKIKVKYKEVVTNG
jgi:DNA-binding Lrp family transcriptional regulator